MFEDLIIGNLVSLRATYGRNPPRDDKDASLLPQHFPDVLGVIMHQILYIRPL